MQKNKKETKRTFIEIAVVVGGVSLIGWLINKNRIQEGIIKNQQLMIEGLTKEVKNLTYHLGKKSKLILKK